jgi:hypothetical protein
MSVYTYLFTVAIPVNYTSEFLEPFEAAMYTRNNKNCYVARNYAASIDNFLPTFRNKLLVPSSGKNNSKERSRFLAPKMKPISCPEKSVRNYQYLMCNKARGAQFSHYSDINSTSAVENLEFSEPQVKLGVW